MSEPIISANLWECLIVAEHSYHQEQCGPKVTDDFLCRLGRVARFHMQEFTVEVTSAGWQIRIFSCKPELVNNEIIILIPKDYKEPVQILKDRIGGREYHHD